MRRSRTVANGLLPALRADPADPVMNSKSLKNIRNYIVFGDFGQALNKDTPIVTGIGQIYADSDRHWTNIRRERQAMDM